LRWLESVEDDLKEMGVRNWRRAASSWAENSGRQFWKRLWSTKVCTARIRGKVVQAFICFTYACLKGTGFITALITTKDMTTEA